MSCLPVSCLRPVVSSQKERPPCCHQDAQQVHQIWSQVSLCLLHAHQDRQQTAGRDRGRVSKPAVTVATHKDIWTLADCWRRWFLSFIFSVMTVPCSTSLRAAWGTKTRWWCMRLPLPLSICPTALPGSWRLLCLVSTYNSQIFHFCLDFSQFV